MKKGDIIENLSIDNIASDGRALGRHDGRVIFVSHLVPGDVADVLITHKKKSYGEGRLVELKSKSPHRIEPVCEHFGICGGCKWQHFNYEKQLEYKRNHVAENLRKISGLTGLPEVQPVIGADPQYAYRNKLEFTFSSNRWLTREEVESGVETLERNALGFHIPGRFDKIIDVKKCHLQADISNEIRNYTKAYCISKNLAFFDLRMQEGLLRNLIVRDTTLGEVMVILVITEWNNDAEGLLKELQTKFPTITSLHYVVNNKRNDSIQDLPVVHFSGKDHIVEQMQNLQYKIGPKSFYQTNSRQAIRLYEITAEYAGLKGDEIVYDLYTGTGTIANFIAAKAKKVVGIEYVEEAVADARENAALNKIDNTTFMAGDMKDLLTEDLFSKYGSPDVIITDPPRAGMHPDVCARLNESRAEKIVYVSCNTASQARDLALLTNYTPTRIQPVDMFPQTAHVENVILLVQSKEVKKSEV